MNAQLKLLDTAGIDRPSGDLADRANSFCQTAPHRSDPYFRRNWGGPLHSLCSYQGKLKPSIAHFLISWFTEPGDRVLDPMAGVGTIPLEARRLGRIGIGNDLSPLAACVTRAKVETFKICKIDTVVDALDWSVQHGPTLAELQLTNDTTFGLNGPIEGYFHPETLREILIARNFFMLRRMDADSSSDVVLASLLHILHGNRPYALSRRSHPITPFAPSGDFEYRSLMSQLKIRLNRIVPELLKLEIESCAGESYEGDARSLHLPRQVDAIITSPPFAQSFRFWSSNWMRLWFAGWSPEDFKTEPDRFLESEQKVSFSTYRSIAQSMASNLKSGGVLVLHLGETAQVNMVDEVFPQISPWFEVVHIGRESVEDTETHGIRDKGATTAHWYLFATKRP
jgi:hypothetical protein